MRDLEREALQDFLRLMQKTRLTAEEKAGLERVLDIFESLDDRLTEVERVLGMPIVGKG